MKKKFQKPFYIDAVKNGAKVETRDGKSVRIICYDRAKTKYPIVALVNYQGVENCFTYNIDGKLLDGETNVDDLVIVEEVESSKFNVGDWVFNMFGWGQHPWLITTVTSDYYELQNTCGCKMSISQMIIDKYYRLWTLKDAKPGDVLICEDDNRPFIFKEDYGGVPSAYCGIDTNDSIRISDGRNNWTVAPVRPATYKENQQFFNRLEEEGYKWDAEYLTLLKIQKDGEIMGMLR